MRIRVDSVLDELGVPVPQRLRFDRREVAVSEVCDRWDGPAYRYYKLLGADGHLYIVRYDDAEMSWDLTMYETRTSGGSADAPDTGQQS